MKTAALFDVAGVSNENDEWYTPSWMFRALGVEFDLDPCSPGAPPSYFGKYPDPYIPG